MSESERKHVTVGILSSDPEATEVLKRLQDIANSHTSLNREYVLMHIGTNDIGLYPIGEVVEFSPPVIPDSIKDTFKDVVTKGGLKTEIKFSIAIDSMPVTLTPEQITLINKSFKETRYKPSFVPYKQRHLHSSKVGGKHSYKGRR